MKNSLLTVSKRILLFFLFKFITIISIGQSNWTSLMPKPLGFLVYDASFPDANNGWAVGESGMIAKTTDGGTTWSYKSLPMYTGNGLTSFRPILYQVQFLNATTGYTVGSNGAFLRTTDGGNSWTYLTGPLGPLSSTNKTINNLFFFDVNNGWLIGDAPNASQAFVYKTTDGGATWTAATNVPIINTPFYGIDFITASTGYICGQSGKVIKTTDGGATWTDISLTTTNYTVIGGTATLPRTQTYRCIVACDANTAIMSSQNNGCVLRTTNGGISWYASANQNVGLPQLSMWQMAKSGSNKDTIILTGGAAVFAKSIDRGLTWTWQQHYASATNSPNSINYYYAAVAFPTVPGKYVMMGASGVINVTNDGGTTWTNPYSSLGTYNGTGASDAKNLFGVAFVDANSGMVVGAHGTVGTTSDGGITWTDRSIASMSQVTGDADYIYSVKCPSLTSSYICTSSWGQIYKSTDFGNTWTNQLDMGGNDGFTGLDFVDNNTGWTCSYLGAVYKTTNGTTWTQAPAFNSTQLNAIDFIDASNGWVVGNSGKIFHSTNGGSAWTLQTSGITNALYGVQFLDANNGFACGASGKVLVTTDGGTTWTQRNIPATFQLNKILFTTPLKGMVFGNGGVYYSTADGGVSWNPLFAPTGDVLQDALIPTGSNNIIVVGGSLFGVHGDVFSLDNSSCNIAITSQPTNEIVCAGTTANFNVTVAGSLFATYQWQLSTDGGTTFNNIAGATSSSYSFTPTGTETGYQYRCQITNSCGSPTTITSSAAALNFNTSPVLTQQPTNQSACLGTPATFSVAATGTGITYQWQISTNGGTSFSNVSTGAVYTGANTPTLTIIAVAATQNTNQFRCVVTGLCTPAINSSAATLSIPVLIATQPSNVTQCAGSNANFSLTATGTGVTVGYQWQLSTDGGTTFSNISNGAVYSGATAATLTATAVTSTMNNYMYRCVTSGGSCTLNSSAVTLTVNTAPSITTQPSATTSICSGLNTSISTTAVGTAITYQWQVSTDGGVTFTNITNTGVYSNATTPTLNITGVTAGMNNYQYRCVVSGTCTPAANTSVSILNVSLPASITAQPSSVSRCSNLAANFSITATGTITGYQWQVSTNGGTSFSNIAGATTNSYSVSSTAYSMNGYQYRCNITTVCSGTLTSNAATLTVFQIPSITIAANPTNNLYPGLTTTLGISNISPVGAVSYTWVKNGTNIAGATNATLGLGVDDNGSYSVAVIDQNGCPGTSNSVTIGLADAGKLFIYPNPTTGIFQVRLYSSPSATTPRSLNVYDFKGAVIYSKAYPINGSYQRMDVDLSKVGSGIYTVVLMDNTGKKLAVGKVVIAK